MLQDMDIEKISLGTAKSQEERGMSGMTQDRPEKKAGEVRSRLILCYVGRCHTGEAAGQGEEASWSGAIAAI